jgi:hypothetical protein
MKILITTIIVLSIATAIYAAETSYQKLSNETMKISITDTVEMSTNLTELKLSKQQVEAKIALLNEQYNQALTRFNNELAVINKYISEAEKLGIEETIAIAEESMMESDR